MVEHHIVSLIRQGKRVSIPNLGGFLIWDRTGENGAEKIVFFNPRYKNDDGLLKQEIATAENVSHQKALEYIEVFASQVKEALRSTRQYFIPNLGLLKLKEDGSFSFEQLPNFQMQQEMPPPQAAVPPVPPQQFAQTTAPPYQPPPPQPPPPDNNPLRQPPYSAASGNQAVPPSSSIPPNFFDDMTSPQKKGGNSSAKTIIASAVALFAAIVIAVLITLHITGEKMPEPKVDTSPALNDASQKTQPKATRPKVVKRERKVLPRSTFGKKYPFNDPSLIYSVIGAKFTNQRKAKNWAALIKQAGDEGEILVGGMVTLMSYKTQEEAAKGLEKYKKTIYSAFINNNSVSNSSPVAVSTSTVATMQEASARAESNFERGRYYLIFGVYSYEENALKLQSKLASQGISSQVIQGLKYHSVAFHLAYGSRSEARQQINRLKQSYYQTIWIYPKHD